MKPVRFISLGVLLLLVGAFAPTYAQQEQQKKEAKTPKQEQQAKPQKQQQDKPAKQQPQQASGQQQRQQKKLEHAQGQQQRQQKQQEQARGQQQQQRQQEAKGRQEQQRQQQQGQRVRVQQSEQRGVWQQHRARSWEAEHRTWQQRGGYNGYRIPDDRYRGYFGQDHWFRIYSYPVEVYGGYPRFQYGGFWFGLIDPWPEYWSDDWYQNDDVYIVYLEDGYYLYNRRHPRDRIAITVYVN
jgi:hypothetical protein